MWGEFWATLGIVGIALLVACTVANTVAAVVLGRLSLPQLLKRRVEGIESKVLDCVKGMEEFAAENAASRAAVEGLIEEARNQFERAERKRASAAATLSRLENQPQVTMPTSRAERIEMMRRLDRGG